MAGHAQLIFFMTECSKTQIRLTRPIFSSPLGSVANSGLLGIYITASGRGQCRIYNNCSGTDIIKPVLVYS